MSVASTTVQNGSREAHLSLAKKGARRIVVDGVPYRWRLRRRPTYSQAMCWSPCTYAVEHADHPGAVLLVTTAHPHPSNWLGQPAAPVRPVDVAYAIGVALRRGWQATLPGRPLLVDLSTT
jgi:hypothetical protein